MINYLKQKIFNRCLQKYKSSRKKMIISLEQVRTMAVLCHITDEDSYKEIHDLFSKLHSPKRNVWLMGYIDEKKVPYYCLPQLSADYFSKQNLNWFGKPNFIQLTDFVKKDFDILIDFTRKDLPPLHYILSTSNAKLIIGANEYAQDYYDIFIKDTSRWNYIILLKNIHNYLLKLTGK